jgi:hypothetical protein
MRATAAAICTLRVVAQRASILLFFSLEEYKQEQF